MKNKKDPAWGSLGTPFGAEIPDEVNTFFGAEAPTPEPTAQWTEEEEKATLQANAVDAVDSSSGSTGSEPADAIVGSEAQSAEQLSVPATEQPAELDDDDLFAAFRSRTPNAGKPEKSATAVTQHPESKAPDSKAETRAVPAERVARAAASSRGSSETGRGRSSQAGADLPETPAKAVAPLDDTTGDDTTGDDSAAAAVVAAEPKTFGQTIRSHWDSLIDTLGIGGKAKAERQRAQAEQKSAQSPAPAATKASASREARSESSGPTPARASEDRQQPNTVDEIPRDAFGFGIFDPPKDQPTVNPLDSLFQSGDDASSEADDVSFQRPTPPAKEASRGRSGRGRGRQSDVQDMPASSEAASSEPGRRVRSARTGSTSAQDSGAAAPAGNSRGARPARGGRVAPAAPVPPTTPVADSELEFEVFDLSGDDISDLWNGPPTPPPRHKDAPAPAGRRRPSEERQGDTAAFVDEPNRGPQRRGEADRAPRGSSRPPRRGVPLPEVEVFDDLDEDDLDDFSPTAPPVAGGRDVTAHRSGRERGAERPARDETRAGRSAGRRPAPDREPDDFEAIDEEPRLTPGRTGRSRGSRTRTAEARPVASRNPLDDLSTDIPVRVPPTRGNRRPVAPPPPPEDMDDDGYTVDNSELADGAEDIEGPRRRPVPTWRRVVDHIVDANLAGRRGGEGRKRHGGGRKGSSAVAARPAPESGSRGRRSNAPTYLDDPGLDDPGFGPDVEADDDFYPDQPRSGGGRRPSGRSGQPPRESSKDEYRNPDDRPPGQRPPGRGRRRY